MKIVFKDQRTGGGETFQYRDGVIEFVRYLNRATEAVHEDMIYIDHKNRKPASRSKSPSSIAASIPRTSTATSTTSTPSTAART